MFELTWQQRQEASIAQACLTNSKHINTHVRGVAPTHIKRSSGCMFEDVNGKSYIDFVCGLGTNLFGWGNERLTQALLKHVREGFSNSLATVHEVEAAEALKELFTFVERVKFLKSGSDACGAAVKFARNYTGRRRVLTDGYHGHDDLFVSLTPPALGVVDDFEIYKLEDDMIDDQVACIIVEDVITDWSEGRGRWLSELREKCTRRGIVLIFDSIITGFRFDGYSPAAYFNVKPDIMLLGKTIAQGLPLSAVCFCNKDLCAEAGVFVSSTYAGEILSLVACKETCISLLSGVYDVKNLWSYGANFISGFNEAGAGIVRIEGYPTRGIIAGEPEAKALFLQETCKAGLFFGPSWFYNFAHIPYNFLVLNSLASIFEKIRLGGVQLEGPLPASPFAQKVRNNANS